MYDRLEQIKREILPQINEELFDEYLLKSIQAIIDYSWKVTGIVSSGGLLALEEYADSMVDADYFKIGLKLVCNGVEPEIVCEVMYSQFLMCNKIKGKYLLLLSLNSVLILMCGDSAGRVTHEIIGMVPIPMMSKLRTFERFSSSKDEAAENTEEACD